MLPRPGLDARYDSAVIDPEMHGPREKLARAQEHMAAFAQGASQLPPIALTWNRNDLEPADEPDTFYLNFHVDEIAEVPVRLSLVLGDAVQNLRASLDYIVLAARSTRAPEGAAEPETPVPNLRHAGSLRGLRQASPRVVTRASHRRAAAIATEITPGVGRTSPLSETSPKKK